MALTHEQIQTILNFSAFSIYSEIQKNALQATLSAANFSLSMAQMELLFGNNASSGLIPDLVNNPDMDSKRQLAKIILNVQEERSGGESYPPTPIIKNILDQLGDYNQATADDVIQLIRDYNTICGNKRIYDSSPNFFNGVENRVSPNPEYLTHYPKNIQNNPPPTVLWCRRVVEERGQFSISFSAPECYNLSRVHFYITEQAKGATMQGYNSDGVRNIKSALDKVGMKYTCELDEILVEIDTDFSRVIEVIKSLEGGAGFARGLTLDKELPLLNGKINSLSGSHRQDSNPPTFGR